MAVYLLGGSGDPYGLGAHRQLYGALPRFRLDSASARHKTFRFLSAEKRALEKNLAEST